MAKLTILEYPDPRLRTRAAPVTVFDQALGQLAEDMLETMYNAKGVGLAATQVNVHKRFLVTDVSEERNQPLVLVNPRLVDLVDKSVSQEGCLSVPGIFEDVERARRIRVEYQDLRGARQELETEGLLGVCIQHEIDHLEGKLFVDYLSELKRERIRKKLEKERRQRPEPAVRSRTPAL
ncbi:MAG TPA: peptide deformylase [Steroidobacteraceae bacterium]|nr:peptide deformylase [Steroidobacteraceae bacterium]